jgi:hypothetical protein
LSKEKLLNEMVVIATKKCVCGKSDVAKPHKILVHMQGDGAACRKGLFPILAHPYRFQEDNIENLGNMLGAKNVNTHHPPQIHPKLVPFGCMLAHILTN